MRLFKLKFHSALHVDARGSGEPEVAEEFVRSDTLSGALCIAWATIYPETGPEFFLDPPFRVGSAFPYVGDALFFPKPVWPFFDAKNETERKTMKKAGWISLSVLSEVLAGKNVDTANLDRSADNAVFLKAELKEHPELGKPPFWKMSERQRVVVDRVGLPVSGGLFYFALQFFDPASGLWFLADAEPEALDKLRRALDYLGDTGIGADRNSGLGHFSVAGESEFHLEPDAKESGWLTLSLFNPSPDDEDAAALTSDAAYGLTGRCGWISGSSVARPPIRAFSEGSWFSVKPRGRVVEMLDPEMIEKNALPISHTAPRDFRAVCLPCAPPRFPKGGGK